ncbi:hypothetical protein [Bacillus sp. AFS015802]|nr:hypothetical protein [Bacillus sp. AFS015802]
MIDSIRKNGRVESPLSLYMPVKDMKRSASRKNGTVNRMSIFIV